MSPHRQGLSENSLPAEEAAITIANWDPIKLKCFSTARENMA